MLARVGVEYRQTMRVNSHAATSYCKLRDRHVSRIILQCPARKCALAARELLCCAHAHRFNRATNDMGRISNLYWENLIQKYTFIVVLHFSLMPSVCERDGVTRTNTEARQRRAEQMSKCGRERGEEAEASGKPELECRTPRYDNENG
jgi:hypothetical protein